MWARWLLVVLSGSIALGCVGALVSTHSRDDGLAALFGIGLFTGVAVVLGMHFAGKL